MKKTLLFMATLAAFSANANQSLRADAELVEDVAYKLAAGFKADDVVYRLAGSNTKSEGVSVQGAGGTTYQSYMGVEARGRQSSFAYGSTGNGGIYRTGGDSFADTLLDVRDGDELEFVRVWGTDTDAAEDLQFFTFERCLPAFGGGAVVSTILDDVESSTSAGVFTSVMIIPAATIIDTQTCTYTTRVRFDSTGDTMQVYKVRAQFAPQL